MQSAKSFTATRPHGRILITPARARRTVVIQAKSASYVAPSSRTGATELDALERFSEVNPFQLLDSPLISSIFP